MRLRTFGCAAALTALILGVACNNASSTENKVDDTAAAAAKAIADTVKDGLITSTIQSKYFASAEVKGYRIDVDTAAGVVSLKGKVETDNERQQAVQIARGVEGVTRVDDQLTVESGARPNTARADAEGGAAWITTKIQSQFYLVPELKPWNIDIDTSTDGVVTLSGSVDSAGDRGEVVRIARSTEGVTRVEDRLRVKGEAASTTGTIERSAARVGEGVTDGWITAKIQSRYFLDDDVKGRNINVDTTGGVVTLRGTVSSQTERSQALAIARNTDGVREVHADLQIVPGDRDTTDAVKRSARDAGRKMNDAADAAGRKAGAAVATAGQKIDDAWITTKLQSKFFIHDEIQAHKIDVDTRDGVVTMTGTVPTLAAKEAAGYLASETRGVTRVVNNLLVTGTLK